MFDREWASILTWYLKWSLVYVSWPLSNFIDFIFRNCLEHRQEVLLHQNPDLPQDLLEWGLASKPGLQAGFHALISPFCAKNHPQHRTRSPDQICLHPNEKHLQICFSVMSVWICIGPFWCTCCFLQKGKIYCIFISDMKKRLGKIKAWVNMTFWVYGILNFQIKHSNKYLTIYKK